MIVVVERVGAEDREVVQIPVCVRLEVVRRFPAHVRCPAKEEVTRPQRTTRLCCPLSQATLRGGPFRVLLPFQRRSTNLMD